MEGQQRTLIRFMLLSLAAAIATIVLKGTAALATGSVGLMSDALESGVNAVAAGFGLWALRLAARPPQEVQESLDRLWRDALGGSAAGGLHVAYRGDDTQGILEISFPTRGLPRRGIDGTADVLDVPVVAEDGRWKIAAAP